MTNIDYRPNFEAEEFLALVNRVWPSAYDGSKIREALTRTSNIGAWDGAGLVGSIRVLSDGYLFAVVSEILVDQTYQR